MIPQQQKIVVGTGAVLMVLGSFMPWATAGIFSVAGTDGDGVITLVLGVLIGASMLQKVANLRVVGMAVVLVSAVCGLIVISDGMDLGDAAGMGIFVVGVGAIVAAFGGIQIVKESIVKRP